MVFGLEDHELNSIENLPTRKEIVFQLLQESIQQDGITVQELKKRVDSAVNTDGGEFQSSILEIFDNLSEEQLQGN